MGLQDDEKFMREALRQASWPPLPSGLNARIMAATLPDTGSAALYPAPVPSFAQRSAALMAAILLICFGLGVVTGASTASTQPGRENPFYTGSSTSLMAQTFKYNGDAHAE